jgi:hypothetical protein
MIKLLSVLVLFATALSSQGTQVRPPAPGCFRLSYTDWNKGGEGREFYEPLPQMLDLRLRVDSASKDSTLIGYREPVGPEGGPRISWRRPDSLTWTINIPRGWSAGLLLRVAATPSPDTLAGSLTDYADYSPRSSLTARIRLVRASCRAS